MGLANSIQNNLSSGFQKMWNKAPQLPQLSINCYKYNRTFVNFVALAGAYALIQISAHLVRKSLAKIQLPIPTLQQMQEKYGRDSWAMVLLGDQSSRKYCKLLAQKGFNLILIGQNQDVKTTRQKLLHDKDVAYQDNIQVFIVDWTKDSRNLKAYEEILQKFKNFDISFLILPGFTKRKQNQVPEFEYVYMMVRQLGPKLKAREYKSAIVVTSVPQIDRIAPKEAVHSAVQSGIDVFGRCIEFQFKSLIEVVIARGGPQNSLACLGIKRISQ